MVSLNISFNFADKFKAFALVKDAESACKLAADVNQLHFAIDLLRADLKLEHPDLLWFEELFADIML